MIVAEQYHSLSVNPTTTSSIWVFEYNLIGAIEYSGRRREVEMIETHTYRSEFKYYFLETRRHAHLDIDLFGRRSILTSQFFIILKVQLSS